MEYDIIEDVIDLSLSCDGLEHKLRKAARLFLDAFPFDQCGIYVWDGAEKKFFLKAWAGGEPCMAEYGEFDGVPGQVKRTMCLVEGHREDPGESLDWTADHALDSARSFVAYPIKDRSRLYGVIVMQSTLVADLAASDRYILGAAARQTAALLKCSEFALAQQRALEDLKDLQARLVSAEKLMALGDMAATLAHEIRSPLISLGGFAARIKKRMAPGSPELPYVEQMLHEVARLEKTINGITRFIKDNAAELKPDELNDILEDALKVFDEEMESRGIALVKDFCGLSLPLLADRDQLKIAFDNLIANAIQSMEKGGTLIISTALAGEYVYAKVSDSGGGIDPQHMEHIFNPFFTTKKQGTGLGLPITRSIVMRHKGVIEVANNLGVGVTFTIKFPHAEENKGLKASGEN